MRLLREDGAYGEYQFHSGRRPRELCRLRHLSVRRVRRVRAEGLAVTVEEQMKVAENVIALLNNMRRLEQMCGLPSLSEDEEALRDAKCLHAALSKAQEDGPTD